MTTTLSTQTNLSLPTETSLATLWLILVRLVTQYGVDGEDFIREIGINPAVIRDPAARIPRRFGEIAFARALACVPDPAFGLQAAKCWHPSNLGVAGYAWLSSKNLRTGLKRLERFSQVFGPRVNFRCKEENDGLRFIFGGEQATRDIEYLAADFSLSIVLEMCRLNAGTPLKPLRARLMRPRPENPQPYLDFFGCDIQFGAEENSFTLGTQLLDAALPSAHEALAVTFDAILNEQLLALNQQDFRSLCQHRILQQLTSGEPTETALAESLGMSRRTLNRRLAENGITYQKLLDQTRYELALRYLDDPKKSVTDITFLLGFSEQSALTRAFRRWHGDTPTHYRRTSRSTG